MILIEIILISLNIILNINRDKCNQSDNYKDDKNNNRDKNNKDNYIK